MISILMNLWFSAGAWMEVSTQWHMAFNSGRMRWVRPFCPVAGVYICNSTQSCVITVLVQIGRVNMNKDGLRVSCKDVCNMGII
jgi:hypothetical protein